MTRLKQNPRELLVLGDGNQSKPYVYVADCVDALLFGFQHAAEPLNVYNVAPPDATRVGSIAELCVACSPEPQARLVYAGGERGWPGDVPQSRLDATRLAELGYTLETRATKR